MKWMAGWFEGLIVGLFFGALIGLTFAGFGDLPSRAGLKSSPDMIGEQR